MKYTLMHKNIPVMKIEIDDDTYNLTKIEEIYDQKHAPLGTMNAKGEVERKELHQWWFNRSIPMSRSGIRDALKLMDVSMPQMLVEECLALSLSDQYWIRPAL